MILFFVGKRSKDVLHVYIKSEKKKRIRDWENSDSSIEAEPGAIRRTQQEAQSKRNRAYIQFHSF